MALYNANRRRRRLRAARLQCRGAGHPQQLLPQPLHLDHTDLTIAVQAQPGISEEYLDAIHAAIATWAEVLGDCFDGLITLTDVTGSQPSEQRAADIIHYVRHAGGAVFSGMAVCGVGGCPNVLVSSEAPPSLESTDLMGYGWAGSG